MKVTGSIIVIMGVAVVFYSLIIFEVFDSKIGEAPLLKLDLLFKQMSLVVIGATLFVSGILILLKGFDVEINDIDENKE